MRYFEYNDYACWEEGHDYFVEEDNKGCCLNCDYAEPGCLCNICRCSRCSHYTGNSCDLADKWKEEAEAKRENWEDFLEERIKGRKNILKIRLEGETPNQLIEQKILDILRFEPDSSIIIEKLQKMNFSIDDIFLAFDSLDYKKKIRERINLATMNYKGQIGFYEVVKNA